MYEHRCATNKAQIPSKVAEMSELYPNEVIVVRTPYTAAAYFIVVEGSELDRTLEKVEVKHG